MSNVAASDNVDNELPARRADRPITLLHRVEYAAIISLISIFKLFGVGFSSTLAGTFMRTIGPLLKEYSRRGDSNLQKAFPDWDKDQRKRVLGDVWENIGRTGAEYAHLHKLSIHGESPKIAYSGFDRLRNEDGTYQQAIFVTGHFANWEIPAVCANQLGIKFGIIYRASNNPLVDGLIIQMRAETMTRAQAPKGRRGARELVSMLKKGYSLAMLVDQKLNDGVSVPFFGREAMTAPAAARMALKFKVPLVPISTERIGSTNFHVKAHAPIKFEPSGDTTADVYALTKKINESLETFITERPGQWLWLHRRWPKELK